MPGSNSETLEKYKVRGKDGKEIDVEVLHCPDGSDRGTYVAMVDGIPNDWIRRVDRAARTTGRR